jgi:sugar phosphate isomerase/epimerase
VPDLQALADAFALRDMRIAYENWCWSSHAPTWADAWRIVRAVDRPNVGLCLDTFQAAGAEWADPTRPDGRMQDLSDEAWKESIDALARSVLAEKIFLLQVSDAYRPNPPLEDAEVDGMRPRARWSHAFRPVPGEGYLPVGDFAAAVLRTGFRGWFSMEVFDGGPEGKGKQYELGEFAKNAMNSHRRLIEDCTEYL